MELRVELKCREPRKQGHGWSNPDFLRAPPSLQICPQSWDCAGGLQGRATLGFPESRKWSAREMGGGSCRNESSPEFLIPIEDNNNKGTEPWHHVTGAELVPIPKPAEETSLY